MTRWRYEYPDKSWGIVMQTAGGYLAVHLPDGFEGGTVLLKQCLDEAQRALDSLAGHCTRNATWTMELIGDAPTAKAGGDRRS